MIILYLVKEEAWLQSFYCIESYKNFTSNGCTTKKVETRCLKKDGRKRRLNQFPIAMKRDSHSGGGGMGAD